MASLVESKELSAADGARWWHQPWPTLVFGYLLAFGVGVGTALWTRSYCNWDHGLPWERTAIVRMHVPLPGWVDGLMLVFPWFGTNISLIPGIALIVWWLWVRQHRRTDAMRLAVVQLGSYLLNPSLKALFNRARPDLYPRRGWYGWSAYPSGHAIASVSVLITLAIILRRAKGWTWPFYVFIPIMLASLYSRVYLGVHWPTDVLSGAAVGVVWLLITSYAYRDRYN